MEIVAPTQDMLGFHLGPRAGAKAKVRQSQGASDGSKQDQTVLQTARRLSF